MAEFMPAVRVLLIWWPGRPRSPRPRHALLTASRRSWWEATQAIRTVYRKESRPAGEAGRPMRGNHLGSLSFGGQGGRVDLGRDTRRRTASRRRGWKATQTIRTVYRKESRPAGEA